MVTERNRVEVEAPKARIPLSPVKIGVVIAYLVMLLVNVLSTTGIIGGISTAEVSNLHPTLFTPAGVTFSIWGVIYLLLGVYVIYQLGFLQASAVSERSALLERLGILFIASCAINVIWLFLWQFKALGVAMIFMIALLALLIFITITLRDINLTLTEKIVLKLPFSIYFGWITVATIANAAVLLVSLDWNGFGVAPWLWTIIMVVVGTAIAIVTTFRNKDIPYALAVAWGLIGIIIRHVSSAYGFSGAYPQVTIFTAACVVILLMACGYLVAMQRASKK